MSLGEDPQDPRVALPKKDREKAVYSRPVLILFGSVVKLTQNGEGSGVDGSPGAMSMMCL